MALTILEAVEQLRKGVVGGLVKQDQQYILILARRDQGFEVYVEWIDHPSEKHYFLEENHLLTWWNRFVLEKNHE